MAKQAKKLHKLEDLLVEEVSVVDRPANQRRFLVVKDEAGKGEEIQMGADGNLTTDDPSKDSKDPPPIADIFKTTGEGFAELQKRLTIDPDLRRDMFRSLSESMGRLNSVLNSAEFAQTDRDGAKGPSTLVPILSAEVAAVAKDLADMAKQLSKGIAKKNDDDPEPETAAQEALLKVVEAVEAEVQKRGAKMSKARLAAFKGAMETLAKILGELAMVQVDKAAHDGGPHVHTFKVNGQTVITDAVNAGTGKAHTHKVTAAFKKLTTSSAPGESTHTITVDGKTMTSSGPTKPKEKPAGGNPFANAKKAEEPSQAVVDLTKMVGDLTTTVKKQAKDLRTLRQARPGSNSIPVEKAAGDGPPRSSVSWPLDLNDEKTPERVDKATSFLDS